MKRKLLLALVLFAISPILSAVTASDASAANGKLITDRCRSYVRSGWLYKPSSDHSGAPREGRPLVIFPRNKPNKANLKVYATDGTQICSFKRYSEESKYGRRFYSGTGCKKSASQIAALARAATGSQNVYIEAAGTGCIGPINPRNRTDRR